MCSSTPIDIQRRWMYERLDPQTGLRKEEFEMGLQDFMNYACQRATSGNMIWCPCMKCKNRLQQEVNRVWTHLFNRGFKPNYFVWTSHGERIDHPPLNEDERCTDPPSNEVEVELGEWDFYVDLGGEHTSTSEMPNIVCDEQVPEQFDEPIADVPNEETASFLAYLDATQEPLYKDCVEGLSKFSFASDMMTVKTKHDVTEETFDDFQRVYKHTLPAANVAVESYQETEKVMRPLRMSCVKIDVCSNNCMIYWTAEDNSLLECKFCQTPRFKPEKRRSRRGDVAAKRVPFKRMFYLPLADRLKRMYLSQKTASNMRWHDEHSSRDGKMQHPSDGKAWKHFNRLYPDFATENRNVYLGLSTDGFNPFGSSGANYSLWPVILTPYNLPPEMCMKQEFLFLTILIPGPDHPKRSLDIFLQPLIEELQSLWTVGVDAFDISVNQCFNLRAVLLWTISDFPAYGMLSGWTTHGRLSCPYCMEETDAFYLSNGRKLSWFDCHRRYLPRSHGFRKSQSAFRSRATVSKGPPPEIHGPQIEYQLQTINGLHKSEDLGGNGHRNEDIDGYGQHHNWHKQSIFWDLPYWRTHLIRHNLDVMHIEKNFFDNIHHTIFNVVGKTKDSINSRHDLPLYCERPSLHITPTGRAPIPIFRLLPLAKSDFLNWLKNEVKFPDGYVSNIGRSINEETGKMHGLKSHDCHVMMQRIYPFAFFELLSPAVHKAISDVGIFFRDICARSLKYEVVDRLKSDIPLIICNLEKIFPPSFFDVMEHLPIHLPTEAELGGPVQFRWMYPFERFMFTLKKKAKNKARVEGSIVEAFLNEEISNFTSQYYNIPGTIMNDVPRKRHTAGYFPQTTYDFDVPEMFRHVGSGSGKPFTVYLNSEDRHIAHTYILLNCPEMAKYERWYDESMLSTYPGITDEELSSAKQLGFSTWLQELVKQDYSQTMYPLWVHEIVGGPIRQCVSWNRYFSRGYNFHTVNYGEHRATNNYGICVRGKKADDPSYYGKLQQVIQIAYHGAIGLKVTLFRCDWFDTTWGTGTRMRRPGVIELLASGRYQQYDPFILSTQADQVCFLRYPGDQSEDDEWLVAVKVSRRGLLDESGKPLDAVQEEQNEYESASGVNRVNVDSLVIPGGQMEDIPEDPENNNVSEYDSDVLLTESEGSPDSDSE